jgi:hypothetical protein
MMKIALLTGLIFSGFELFSLETASAQDNFYRVYDGALVVGAARVPVQFKVNDRVEEVRMGEPEIPGHGFIRRSISVSVIEGRLSCDISLYLESGEVRTCSGLRLRIQNPEDLLSEKTVTGKVYLASSDASVGTLELGLKHTQAGDHEGSRDD